jgi:hypothetical protein
MLWQGAILSQILDTLMNSLWIIIPDYFQQLVLTDGGLTNASSMEKSSILRPFCQCLTQEAKRMKQQYGNQLKSQIF